MSNYFIFISDREIKNTELKLKQIYGNEIIKIVGNNFKYFYALTPTADVEITKESNNAPDFYNETRKFFYYLYSLCSEHIKCGTKIAFMLTYCGQRFDIDKIETLNFAVENFLNQYLCFNFDTVYFLT